MKVIIDHPSATIGIGISFLVLFIGAFIYCNTIPLNNMMVNVQTGERLSSSEFADRQNPFLYFAIGVSIFVIILGVFGLQQSKQQKVKSV